jgi:formylglycine-generating enzyme
MRLLQHFLAAASAVPVCVLLCVRASADVFAMGGSEKSLEFVTVGDAGNAADTRYMNDGTTGYGAVSYAYQIGEYDVTAAQYCDFLNAVAKADPYGLYNQNMAAVATSIAGCGISRSGNSGSFLYYVGSGYANLPVNYVSWGDAARFCNWLTNGQPTGVLTGGASDYALTENGSYALNGMTDPYQLAHVTRAPGARYAIPSENEWYKAAYYKGGSINSGYWRYSTQSDSDPASVPPPGGAEPPGAANYFSTQTGDVDHTVFLTPVGSYGPSGGPYGTFDQGGDVYQWTEGLAGAPAVEYALRGGSYGSYAVGYLTIAANARYESLSNYEGSDVGFRVVSVGPFAAAWNGSAGQWSDASRWSTNPTFPNNGSPVGTNYDVTIASGSVVLDVNANISSLKFGKSGNTFSSQLDLTNKILILQSVDPADKQSNVAQLTAAVRAGSSGGIWTGNGLTSSTAANNSNHYAVAIFDNGNLDLSTFDNEPVDAYSLIVTIAHLGDANANGVIDIQDQSIVTNHWQQPATTWDIGDLNLDGFVDIQDLTMVTNNWQQSSTLTLSPSAPLAPTSRSARSRIARARHSAPFLKVMAFFQRFA